MKLFGWAPDYLFQQHIWPTKLHFLVLVSCEIKLQMIGI